MSAQASPPVLVAGLGPVGATLALLLARQGLRVVAIERDPQVFPHPRAVALDDDALRVLQAAGVTTAGGLELRPAGAVRLRGRAGVPLVELPPVPVATGHPGLAFFRQPQLERLLRARLAAEPLVEVRLGAELVALGQDGGGVRARLRAAGGGEELLEGAALVGCDGARSTVRGLLGVRLAGRSAGADWLVVDTAAPAAAAAIAGGLVAGDFEFTGDPRRPWVHGPLPGGGHRWEFMLAPDEATAADPALARALLSARLGGAPPPALLRAAVYTFHARVATRWRSGRILLAGDAAHLAPPFAGQGLGAGLRDAHNLAWKLAAVVQGRAAGALLDSYARERLPHVVRMTALAAAMGAVVQARRPRATAARDAALPALVRAPGVPGWIARGGWKPPSALGRGALLAGGGHRHRAGQVLPQPVGPGAAGAVAPTDDALGPGFVLLGAGHDPAAALGPAARAAAARMGVACRTTAAVTGGDALARWLAPASVALVRPDRIVFGTAARPQDAERLLDALGAALAR